MKKTESKKNSRGDELLSGSWVKPDLIKHLHDQANKRNLSLTTILAECIQYHKENSTS